MNQDHHQLQQEEEDQDSKDVQWKTTRATEEADSAGTTTTTMNVLETLGDSESVLIAGLKVDREDHQHINSPGVVQASINGVARHHHYHHYRHLGLAVLLHPQVDRL
jgi:hypothetical protein